MSIEKLIEVIKQDPQSVEFEQVMEVISDNYDYTPTSFTNGAGDDVAENPAGKNEGSCKIFAFAKLNNLSQAETLACFGKYYRDDVLKNPEGDDHGNIRSFIKHGWDHVNFESEPLSSKS